MLTNEIEEQLPAWSRFEDLAKRILIAKGFDVEVNSIRGNNGYDLKARFDNKDWAIEVKFYRTTKVRSTLIEAAAARVLNNGVIAQQRNGMLIVSSILSKELRETLQNNFQIIFIDRNDLRVYASTHSSLVDELDALLELESEFIEDRSFVYAHDLQHLALDTQRFFGEDKLIKSVPLDSRGTEFVSKLSLVPRGKSAWARYEKLCIDILKYLFPDDLDGWYPQKSTDGGANRFDFVCRVRQTTEFWNFLVAHLNSRYVIFEFKNYTEKVKQGQVLTTEKYLMERALRRVAIMLTRYGASESAKSMAQGAMREQGKLILILDDADLIEMLERKEQGEDPTDYLFDKTDDFLLSLPR